MKRSARFLLLVATLGGWLATAPAQAELQILLPLGRQAYQTNERIDLAVVRSGTRPCRPAI